MQVLSAVCGAVNMICVFVCGLSRELIGLQQLGREASVCDTLLSCDASFLHARWCHSARALRLRAGVVLGSAGHDHSALRL